VLGISLDPVKYRIYELVSITDSPLPVVVIAVVGFAFEGVGEKGISPIVRNIAFSFDKCGVRWINRLRNEQSKLSLTALSNYQNQYHLR